MIRCIHCYEKYKSDINFLPDRVRPRQELPSKLLVEGNPIHQIQPRT